MRGKAMFKVVSPLLLMAVLGGASMSVQAADPASGKKIYNQRCAGCHGSNGVPSMPGLPDFSRGEALLRADSEIKRAIENGKGIMPAYRGLLSEYQVLDVIAYLRTLRR